jgi:hypothetical protein
MQTDGEGDVPELLQEEERRVLELRWTQGRLQAHVERLLAFAERRRDEILAAVGSDLDPAALVRATKWLVVRQESVHAPSEMRDQVREIHDEIWIRGERGDYDRERIKHEWTSKHAAAWRRWRVKEYIFVADRCTADLVNRLTRK